MRLIAFLFGPRQRKAEDGLRDQVVTPASLLTLFRASASSTVFVLAIVERSHEKLLIALAISMCLDFFDGILARWKKDETVFGAQLDGLADRLAAYFVLVGTLSLDSSGTSLAIATTVWLQFGVVDQMLSTKFLYFGLWSPDHFYAVDRKIWLVNWSPAAKLASNLPIAAVAIGGPIAWVGAGLAVAVVAPRIATYPLIQEKARELVPELHLAQPMIVGDLRESASHATLARPRRFSFVKPRSSRMRAQPSVDPDRSTGRVSA